jgi:hypothetical protein
MTDSRQGANMKLFLTTVDGCVIYYTAAESADDCRRIICETEGNDFEPDTEVETEELPRSAAEKKLLRCDDAPAGLERVSLWVLFEATTRPEVIGCSEW